MKKIIIWSVLVVLTLIIGSTLFLMTTRTGLQLVVNSAIKQAPGQLSIGSIDGRLLDHLEISDLHYADAKQNISLKKLAIHWQPMALLDNKFHITMIDADGLEYNGVAASDTAEPAQTDTTSSASLLPIAIIIDQGTVNNIDITPTKDGTTTSLSGLSAQKIVIADKISIGDLSVTADNFSFSLHGKLNVLTNLQHELTMEWQVKTEARHFSGHGSLNGDRNRLQLSQSLSEPYQVSVHGTIDQPMTGNLDDIRIDLLTEWVISDAQYPASNGQGSISGNTRQITISQTMARPFAVNLQATINDPLASDIKQIQLDVTGDWRDLQWTSEGDLAFASPSGNYHLSGSLAQYQIDMQASLAGSTAPLGGNWHIQGNGTTTDITLTAVEGELLDGKLAANGRVTWLPQLSWTANINGTKINPGAYLPEWPGQLSFNATTNGHAVEQKIFASVDLGQISGILRGYPVAANGAFDLTPSGIMVHHLAFNSDDNIVTASGAINGQLDIDINLNAPNLEALLPSAQGAIIANGKISGPRSTPRLRLSASGNELAYEDIHIEHTVIEMDVDSSETNPSSIKLDIEKLAVAEMTFNTLSLSADGTLPAHQLNASLASPYESLSIAINGALSDQQWTATLTNADITSSRLGKWALEQPTALSISTKVIKLQQTCWASGNARLCGIGRWEKSGGWQGKIDGNTLPLDLVAEFLPTDTHAEGTFEITVALQQASTDRRIIGSATLRSSNGKLSETIVEDVQVDIDYQSFTLSATLDEETISAESRFLVSDQTNIEAAIELPRSAIKTDQAIGIDDSAPLHGRIVATMSELALLPYLVPEIENTRGLLDIDLQIQGTASEPEIIGKASLQDGAADIPRSGLTIRDIQLVLTGKRQLGFDFKGKMHSGKGMATTQGSFGWDRNRRLFAQINLTADHFDVIKIPEYWVTLSSNLDINVQKNNIDLTGNITIPEARIEPRSIASAISPSDDVIIKTDQPTADKAEKWRITSLISLTIGDAVRFDGFGLTGNIRGNLALLDSPQSITTAFGELRIVDGKYRAYGQQLVLEQGRLVYVGGPLDDPGLDLRAVRIAGDVKAGVNVRGALKSPRITIFSEPAMDESNALSYLLLGRPMNQATSSEGKALYGAASSLGLAGGELLAKKIGSAFNIEEVRIESDSSGQEASLFIGKHLSPRIYIRYGVGLIEPINTFLIHYQLSQRWSVEAESGAEQGADFIYTLER